MDSHANHAMRSPLPSGRESASKAEFRFLKHWSKAQLAAVGALIEDVCRSWSAAWEIPAAQAGGAIVSVDGPGEGDFLGGYPLHGAISPGRQARTWIVPFASVPTENFSPERAIRRTLFGEFDGAAPLFVQKINQAEMSGEIAAAAWLDFLGRLVTSLQIDTDPAGAGREHPEALVLAEDRRSWSGAATVTLPWCGEQLRFHLNGICMEKIVPPKKPSSAIGTGSPAPVMPLYQAIEDRPLTVRAQLHAIDIRLGELQALALGDVIVLQHHLDAPALLKTADEKEVCAAFLGKKNGNWALELVAASDPGIDATALHNA